MVIFHGDDYLASRNALQKQREAASQKSLEVLSLDGQKIQLTDLQQAVESLSLFGSDRMVIVENVFGGQKSARQIALIDYLVSHKPNTVLIWENKAITPANLKKLQGCQVQEFKPKTIIFDFLGALRPNNQKQILNLYQQVLATDAVELVFFLVTKQIRQLLQAVSDPESLTGPTWLTGKVLNQAKLFEEEKLVELHRGLYEIEKGLKTGASPLPLETALEFWLNSI